MGSDVTEFFKPDDDDSSGFGTSARLGSLDPAVQFGAASEQKEKDPDKLQQSVDPLDIFGFQKAKGIEEAGAASQARNRGFMRRAEAMRQDILTHIQDRDLQASKAAANARRESRLRTGRSSTILSR